MNHTLINVNGIPFQSEYEKEQAQKIIAVVAKLNPLYGGDTEKSAETARELSHLLVSGSHNFPKTITDIATGGFVARKIGDNKEFIGISLDVCLTDNLFNKFYPAKRKLLNPFLTLTY